MKQSNNMNNFLIKNKEGLTQEDFNEIFYRSLRMNHEKYEQEQFDDLLLELNMKEPEVYTEWRLTFNKVPYFFVRRYTNLITNLVSNNDHERVLIASEMYKKKMALISRSIPEKVTPSTVKGSKKSLYLKLNKALLLMESELEDNILRKAQESFAEIYSKYEDDIYLGDLYNEIIDGFEDEMRNALNAEINKIEGISYRLIDTMAIGLMRETQDAGKKDRNTPKQYRKY